MRVRQNKKSVVVRQWQFYLFSSVSSRNIFKFIFCYVEMLNFPKQN